MTAALDTWSEWFSGLSESDQRALSCVVMRHVLAAEEKIAPFREIVEANYELEDDNGDAN